MIHESGRFVDGAYEVPTAELTERSVVRFECDRRKTLVLADLTGAVLKAAGLPWRRGTAYDMVYVNSDVECRRNSRLVAGRVFHS